MTLRVALIALDLIGLWREVVHALGTCVKTGHSPEIDLWRDTLERRGLIRETEKRRARLGGAVSREMTGRDQEMIMLQMCLQDQLHHLAVLLLLWQVCRSQHPLLSNPPTRLAFLLL